MSRYYVSGTVRTVGEVLPKQPPKAASIEEPESTEPEPVEEEQAEAIEGPSESLETPLESGGSEDSAPDEDEEVLNLPDISYLTTKEVLGFVKAYPEYKEYVLAAEQAAEKPRKGIIKALTA